MDTVGNKLEASAFVSSLRISIMPQSGPIIRTQYVSSPGIMFQVLGTMGTPELENQESLMVFPIPTDSKIAGWRFKSIMLVQILRTSQESVATTWLEGIAEYGVASQDDKAIEDLVISLGEYRESLENRKKELGDSAKNELEYLRKLMERTLSEPS
ncbi:MAG: hypothetical protein Q8O43_10545 [Dehalococcoidia bacterium]|nr:hypothetical protein [Dehalococcoidia bacterium]